MHGTGDAMTLRSCSECGNPAAFSMCNLLSTVAVTPRRQKCSVATLYCSVCIQRLARLLDASGYSAFQKLSQPLGAAYTALATASERDSNGRMERQS
jgi:hypothetical protein